MDKKSMDVIIAYTDGSAVASGVLNGHGGFGTYFPNLFGKRKAFSLGFKDTKTGRMEIMALLYAVKAIPESWEGKLQVYSDSQYVVKTFTEKRLEKWILNNWKSYGNEIKNQDLWKELNRHLILREKMELEMVWIKAHQVDDAKNPQAKASLLKDEHILGNMVVDKLADHKRHINKLETDKLF